MAEIENTPKDPPQTFCGGDMEKPEDFPSVVYKGERIYFCNQNCVRVFHSDPEGFLSGKVEH